MKKNNKENCFNAHWNVVAFLISRFFPLSSPSTRFLIHREKLNPRPTALTTMHTHNTHVPKRSSNDLRTGRFNVHEIAALMEVRLRPLRENSRSPLLWRCCRSTKLFDTPQFSFVLRRAWRHSRRSYELTKQLEYYAAWRRFWEWKICP